MPSRCVVGVDLGGTNVRAGAYFDDGSEAGPKFTQPSNAQDGQDAVFHAIISTVCQATDAATVRPTAVGMAIPGLIDDAAGVVRWSSNFGETINGVFHYWQHVRVRDALEPAIGLPIRFGNDANLAALAEYRFGTGRNKAKCLVMLTLGTGIGGGVVLAPASVLGDARGPLLLLGGNMGGAELGHIAVQAGGLVSNAGVYGDLEAYCGRDGIVERAIHRLQRNRPSMIGELVLDDYSQITPRIISMAAERGDEVAIEVLTEVGSMLGIGIGNYINIVAPEVFAIGGQIAKAGEFLLGPAKNAARNVAVPALFDFVSIVVAEQIEDAGMLGGAALALNG
jgi:glucokinase